MNTPIQKLVHRRAKALQNWQRLRCLRELASDKAAAAHRNKRIDFLNPKARWVHAKILKRAQDLAILEYLAKVAFLEVHDELQVAHCENYSVIGRTWDYFRKGFSLT